MWVVNRVVIFNLSFISLTPTFQLISFIYEITLIIFFSNKFILIPQMSIHLSFSPTELKSHISP